MANPRQRRKTRSSSYKPVSHSRRAKKLLKKTPPIRGPKVLQDAWDNHKTVRQNYAALGLIHSLNPTASGGTECPLVPRAAEPKPNTPGVTTSESQNAASHNDAAQNADDAPAPAAIPRGHARIVRDEAGNVLRVEYAAEDEEEEEQQQRRKTADKDMEGDVDMEALEPKLDERASRAWVGGLGTSTSTHKAVRGRVEKEEGGVVQALEKIGVRTSANNGRTISAPLSLAGPRHASAGERAYLQRLVDKYGKEDVAGMARDRRLNGEQRTAGELGRSLKRIGLV
ncbi:hypothetical protein HGRIS_013510 [Hohenbuehelia grisea]|uniref:Nucleolar protein 16 n=1 Tax=Hohenbuehelia grisea TaxID=104357 RepID=A0ABR3IVQ3_9AGAR